MSKQIILPFFPLCHACQTIKAFHDNLNEAERERYGIRKDVMVLTDWEGNKKAHYKHWPVEEEQWIR